MKPLVSVLMGVHNEEEWVMNAVTSIIHQSYENLEIIIVDDGSTDNTPNILKNLQMHDKRIKVITQENMGLTKALNVGLKKCTGKYIARMDADNTSHISRIKKQVEFMEANPNCAVVGTWRKDVFEDGSERILKLPVKDKYIKLALVKTCVISHSSVMMKAVIVKSLKYNQKFRVSQDYELWTRIGKNCELRNLGEILTTAYHRETSITRTTKILEKLKYNLLIRIYAYSRLKCPLWYFVFIPKPIVEALIPDSLIKKYVDWKMRK